MVKILNILSEIFIQPYIVLALYPQHICKERLSSSSIHTHLTMLGNCRSATKCMKLLKNIPTTNYYNLKYNHMAIEM